MPRLSQDGQPDAYDAHSKKLHGLGFQKTNFDQHISAMRALQSQRAGVAGWQAALCEKRHLEVLLCFFR